MDVPSPCLLRSFSHPSDSSREASEGHIAHAFGGSVSFGRYMTESLDWVKFSTFSQNRYLEEAEQCMKPGHVAQKKAYFEDYFKNIAARKAKALVEEPTTSTTKITETSSTATDFANADMHPPVYVELNIDTPATSSPSSLDANECHIIAAENESDNGRLEGLELVQEQQACAEESTAAVKISNELENENVDSDVREGNVLVKESDNDEDIVASANKKKCRIPSPKSFTHNRVPNIPLPPAIKATLRPLTVGSKAPTDTKKAKKRLAPTSLHGSINFGSSIDKTSPIRQQIRRSRVHSDTSQTSTKASSIGGTSKNNSTTSSTPNEASVYKTSKDSSRPSRISKRSYDHEISRDSSKTLRTQSSVCGTSGDSSNTYQPLRASVNRISIVKSKASQTLNMASLSIASKRPSVTTKSEDSRRTKTQINKLVSGANTGTAVRKWYSQSVDHSKSINASGNKSGSTTTKAIPFSFRSDERAAKRKKFFEKMEEKSDAKEAEKEHLQTGSKRKIEDSWAKLRQSTGTCLKTNPNTAFHVSPSLNNHSKKIPPTQPRSPKLGRRPAPSVQDKITVKSSTRKSNSKQALEKGHNKTASLLKKNASENASPNIQN